VHVEPSIVLCGLLLIWMQGTGFGLHSCVCAGFVIVPSASAALARTPH
jgi:hypothetical protein